MKSLRLKKHLAHELARAEAVISNNDGTKKPHTPTLDNHRGQALAFKKAMAFLEMDPIYPSTITVVKTEYKNLEWERLVTIVKIVGISLVSCLTFLFLKIL